MPGLRGVHRVAGDLATSRFPPLDSSVLSMPPPGERRKNDVRDHRRERRRDCDEGECRIVESHRQLVGPGEAREGDTAQYDGEGNRAKPNREIVNTSSGAITTPPALPPFIAQLRASPRRLSNQGATMILMAAPLIVAHPSDITAKAA